MSTKESVKLPSKLLVDVDVFFSYLVEDDLCSHTAKLIENANRAQVKLVAPSEHCFNVAFEVVIEFIADLRKLSHEILPTTVDVAEEAMHLYSEYGGSRKLHYFDSFHAATAKQCDLPLVTSGRYLLRNSEKLGIKILDLREI